ncbi:hypothetical protein DL93DRAFT_2102917 [Clavulina sp. PMI_390]|nr:hypothetical protein DL93DRAFT_2102917 [Clavulina sp. PMI_390]
MRRAQLPSIPAATTTASKSSIGTTNSTRNKATVQKPKASTSELESSSANDDTIDPLALTTTSAANVSPSLSRPIASLRRSTASKESSTPKLVRTSALSFGQALRSGSTSIAVGGLSFGGGAAFECGSLKAYLDTIVATLLQPENHKTVPGVAVGSTFNLAYWFIATSRQALNNASPPAIMRSAQLLELSHPVGQSLDSASPAGPQIRSKFSFGAGNDGRPLLRPLSQPDFGARIPRAP